MCPVVEKKYLCSSDRLARGDHDSAAASLPPRPCPAEPRGALPTSNADNMLVRILRVLPSSYLHTLGRVPTSELSFLLPTLPTSNADRSFHVRPIPTATLCKTLHNFIQNPSHIIPVYERMSYLYRWLETNTFRLALRPGRSRPPPFPAPPRPRAPAPPRARTHG